MLGQTAASMYWDWQKFFRSTSTEDEQVAENTNADIPIKKGADDLLRRTTFAGRIADVLCAAGGHEGRVFAIRGDWGNGKSSLKNLIIEKFRSREPKPDWLEFNPWQWGDSDAITRALFFEMASKLGGKHSPKAAARARSFRKYGAVLSGSAGHLQQAGEGKGVAEWITSVGLMAAGFGIGVQGVGSSLLPLSMTTIAAALLVIAGAVRFVAMIVSAFGRDRSAEPLPEVRKDLETRLRKLKQPLIIFVDDIDRLEPEQIRLIFRQIKVNANLPNIVFVLLFQPSIVVKALEPVAGAEGSDYLEKIIQANFDLPAVPARRIAEIFSEQLQSVVGQLALAENGFEQRRWGNVFLGSMQPFIANLRDMRRLLSSIAIHVPLHQGSKAFEANMIDLLALETLRVFEPEIHKAISRSKALLLSANGYHGDAKGAAQKTIQGLVEAAAPDHRPACKAMLRELFPTAEWAFGGSHYGSDWFGTWNEAKRVCADRYFDRYFELQVSDGTVSDSDFADFIESSADARSLADAVARLEAAGVLADLAARLDESVKRLPIGHLPTLLPAMFEIGEKLNSRSAGPMNTSYVAAWRAACWFLREEPDAGRRSDVFLEALRGSELLSVPAMLISLDMDAREKDEPTKEFLFTDDSLAAAKTLWVDKIKALATRGALETSAEMLSFLYRWRDFSGGFDEPRAWLDRIAADERQLPELVMRFISVGTSQALGDYFSIKTEKFQRQTIEDFFDLDELAGRLSRLDRAQLSAAQAEAVKKLEASLANWRASPPVTAS